jgi:cellulose synthase/poly-beta-1,6-N-acetylglucosamine synthase-like glycosyltransferase
MTNFVKNTQDKRAIKMGGIRKTLVIIPAYNEEETVEKVVKKVKDNLPQADILIVNDGSVDLTSERARRGGDVVLDLPFTSESGERCKQDTNMPTSPGAQLQNTIAILKRQWHC